jgi:AraC-like DNA-binding protein
MLDVYRLAPSRPLSPYVRVFENRSGTLKGQVSVRPLPARYEQFIEFYLADPYLVRSKVLPVRPAPRVVVVGIHTHRGDDLLLSGGLDVFTVQFTPTGFQAIFGIPQSLLTDLAVPALDLIPHQDIDRIAAQLAETGSFEGRVAVIEAWLCLHLARRRMDVKDPIASAANAMTMAWGNIRIDRVVAETGLSSRQFERRFRTQVGTGPKRYARILRFSRALRLRQSHPNASWTAIAHEAGFSDQAHMIHEFHALSGERPAEMFAALGRALD